MKVLVVNAGSSSLKAQLMETETGEVFANAYCERVGINDSFMTYKWNGEKAVINQDMANHKEAFQLFLNTLTTGNTAVISSLEEIKAIGHRVVNLGEKYNKSVVVTSDVFDDMQNYLHFAPLHNPGAMSGIKACMELMPSKKNVAVFDTAFHSTMPEKAYMYAIPYELYEENKIRRYGAHGTSHRYIARSVGQLVGDLKGKKIISCHIGSGSSVCAIKDGECVDTSMGYTPLAGVVMGTRSGDIDANLDKPKVKLAFDMLVYSLKKYIGAYAAAMNGVDYIVFTAGIGEKDELVREAVCKDMEYLGIELDVEKNLKQNKPFGEILEITKPSSKVKVLRIPTDEEFMIALDTAELAK